MKAKSIYDITEQFGRINHFAKSYWLRAAALETANKYLANIYAYFGMTFHDNRAYIGGREISLKEQMKIRRRKVSAKIYAA